MLLATNITQGKLFPCRGVAKPAKLHIDQVSVGLQIEMEYSKKLFFRRCSIEVALYSNHCETSIKHFVINLQ